MNYKDEFVKWLNNNISIVSVTVDNYSQNKILSNLDKLSTYFKKDIFSINDVSEIEYMDAYLFNNDSKTSSEIGISLPLYKQFLISTYKEDIDIGNTNDTKAIHKYLCTWPIIYVIVDKDDKYVTQIVKNNDHNELCYLLYTHRSKIKPELLKENKVLEIKSNLFFFEIDNDENSNAYSIVVNPNFNNDEVFIYMDELLFYYDPVFCSNEFN